MPLVSGRTFLPLLYIDDSEDERGLVKEAISITQTPLVLFDAGSLEEGIRFFEREGPHSGEYPVPVMVLLDYDLGTNTGLDFLYWLRVMKEIKSVPVVMFSGSPEENYVASSYAAGASYFVSKPMELLRLQIVVQTLHLSLLGHHGPDPILSLQEYRSPPRGVE